MSGGRTQDTLDDIASCLGFYTRLPVRWGSQRSFADAQWAAPVAGLVVGAIGWLAFFVADAAGLPATVAAALSVASTIAGAPDCPNPQWTEAISDLAFTSAVITIQQPPGTTVLTVSCTFSPPTSNGPVPGGSVSCSSS